MFSDFYILILFPEISTIKLFRFFLIFFSIKVTFNQVSERERPSGVERSERSYVVEISGELLPFSVTRLVAMLRDRHYSHDSTTDIRMWTDGLSSPLNHIDVDHLVDTAAFEDVGTLNPHPTLTLKAHHSFLRVVRS